jgi:arginine repressor
MRAQIRSKSKTSPFRMQTSVTRRGVFFDRLDGNSKMLMIHTTPRQARLLAQWILDNVHPED